MATKLRSIGQKIGPPRRTKLRTQPKQAAAIYSTREWRLLMDQIISERGRRCEDPLHDAARPRTGIRLFGDHIKELADGGAPFDKTNVMLRCGSCHTRKTAEERAKRRGSAEGEG